MGRPCAPHVAPMGNANRLGICCSERSQASMEARERLLSAAACQEVFELPAPPLGSMSSGTRFFKLVPANAYRPVSGQPSRWIGKDLAQSFDELQFYFDASSLRNEGIWR